MRIPSRACTMASSRVIASTPPYTTLWLVDGTLRLISVTFDAVSVEQSQHSPPVIRLANVALTG